MPGLIESHELWGIVPRSDEERPEHRARRGEPRWGTPHLVAIRQCECGTWFNPQGGARQCASCAEICEAQLLLRHPARPCAICGTLFRSAQPAQRTCGSECGRVFRLRRIAARRWRRRQERRLVAP